LNGSNNLETLVMPAVQAAGYRLVRLRLMGGKRKTLQIMAERADGQMDVEDCAKLSRLISEVLEAPTRSRRNMCWKFPRPASIGR